MSNSTTTSAPASPDNDPSRKAAKLALTYPADAVSTAFQAANGAPVSQEDLDFAESCWDAWNSDRLEVEPTLTDGLLAELKAEVPASETVTPAMGACLKLIHECTTDADGNLIRRIDSERLSSSPEMLKLSRLGLVTYVEGSAYGSGFALTPKGTKAVTQ